MRIPKFEIEYRPVARSCADGCGVLEPSVFSTATKCTEDIQMNYPVTTDWCMSKVNFRSRFLFCIYKRHVKYWDGQKSANFPE